MVWMVERLKFNENVRQYEFNGVEFFESDEELWKFINNVMVYTGRDYLWRITKLKEVEEVGSDVFTRGDN